MKNVYKMKKAVGIISGIVLIMGMTACSLGPKEGETTSEAIVESKITMKESVESSGEDSPIASGDIVEITYWGCRVMKSIRARQ